MRTGLRVEVRWQETLLDVAYVGRDDGAYAVADVPVVRGGKLLGTAFGRVGLVTYAVEAVVMPARLVGRARGDDRRLVPYFAVALVAHIALWAIADEREDRPDESRETRRAVPGFATPVRTSLGDTIADDKSDDTKTPGRGTPMQLAPGVSGVPQAERVSGHVSVARRDTPKVERNMTIAEARTAGLLGASTLANTSFQTLAGHDDLTSGFDETTTNAPPLGGDGEARGTFGFARTDFNSGGQGDTYHTIGVARTGDWSNGTSPGQGWGGGRGGADSLPGRMQHVPTMRIGPCDAEGGLDAKRVRRYVKRRSAALQFCYEKALLAKPGLAGDVHADFVIDGGKVLHATATGVDPDVAACTAAAIEASPFEDAPVTSASITLTFAP